MAQGEVMSVIIYYPGGWCVHASKPDCQRGVDVPTCWIDGVELCESCAADYRRRKAEREAVKVQAEVTNTRE